jgi:hypothetical protein
MPGVAHADTECLGRGGVTRVIQLRQTRTALERRVVLTTRYDRLAVQRSIRIMIVAVGSARAPFPAPVFVFVAAFAAATSGNP